MKFKECLYTDAYSLWSATAAPPWKKAYLKHKSLNIQSVWKCDWVFLPYLYVLGRDIPQVSKIPYLDPWQWNSPLCVFHQGKYNILIHKWPNTSFAHADTRCETFCSAVWKNKLCNVLKIFNIVQIRYRCGEKRESGGKTRAGDVHIWSVLFLAVSPIQHWGN